MEKKQYQVSFIDRIKHPPHLRGRAFANVKYGEPHTSFGASSTALTSSIGLSVFSADILAVGPGMMLSGIYSVSVVNKNQTGPKMGMHHHHLPPLSKRRHHHPAIARAQPGRRGIEQARARISAATGSGESGMPTYCIF